MIYKQKHTNSRNNYFDFVSGIAMLWIIVWHIFQHLKWNDTNTAACFTFLALAWFFFRSGYFYKQSMQPAIQYIKEKFRRLFIPFICWSFIGFILWLPYRLWEHSDPLYKMILDPFYYFLWYGSGGNGNLAIWFLLTLFGVFIVIYFIDKWKLNKLIFLFPVIGALLSFFKIQIFFGLNNIFLATSFFALGRVWKQYNEKTSKMWKLILLGMAILPVYLSTYHFSVIGFWTNTTIQGNYLMAF